jgi:hypothetical protein
MHNLYASPLGKVCEQMDLSPGTWWRFSTAWLACLLGFRTD